jgi:DNA ligase D-like protein (predicted ligase)
MPPRKPARAAPAKPHRALTQKAASPLPRWIAPQLSKLVDEAPSGEGWAHEIKYDGYRLHARIDHGRVALLTRTGLDWTEKYPGTAEALRSLPVDRAYLDGELTGVRPDGTSSFALIQNASDTGAGGLVFFLFDLLHLDGEDLMPALLLERKERLQGVLANNTDAGLQFSGHVIGHGPEFRRHACSMKLEGVVSKRIDAPYRPADRGLWVKSKCLNREEFVVVGWTDPEGGRGYIGALLLGYFTPEGELVYAGRVGTGMTQDQLRQLLERLKPVAARKTPLRVPPPRSTRFGSPVELSRVHWVKPEMVVEITYLTWTEDSLLRHTVYQGVREDKPAREVVRERPNVR